MDKYHNDQQMDSWAIRFAQFIAKHGTLRVSVIFFLFTLAFTLAGSYVLRINISGRVDIEDYFTAVILTLVGAPWILYFFSELVKQLEASRNNLQVAINELARLREDDVSLTAELKEKVEALNKEAEKRLQAQREREQLVNELEDEIKDRTRKEEEAKRFSSLLRSIIDASPDLIYYRNEEGKFAGCNRIAEQMTGKTEAQLIGLTPHEVYDEEIAQTVVASDQEVLETNAGITEEQWLKFSDGRRRYFEMRKVPFFDNEGNRLGLLAFGRDITERKKAENALTKASKDKTAFIATISHELRTPLNGIVGLSRMLRDTQLSDEQFKWVSTIYASAITLGNIFNDIIDLDKLDRDKLELSPKTVSLKEFSGELSSIIELLAADKGLSFSKEVKEPLPDFIEIDGTRLRQVLWNLLFNAVKFTQKGEVKLTVEASKPEDNACIVQFTVSDTGIGIPADELDKIFAMYYQVDDPSHHSATGTGIGLAICQQMVTMMGGKIEVHSQVGSGTCFSVELPVQLSSSQIQVEDLKVTGLNILLVEDIELNVMVAKALLEKLGQTVDVAMTGQEAIDKAKASYYDLILLDIQLPDMNGFDVAQQLQAMELVDSTPMVALTANVIKKRQDYLDNGMDDVISKPVKKSRVIRVLNNLFGDDPLQTPPVIEAVKVEEKLDTILDMELLTMLADTIGPEMIANSIEVLEANMPDYLDVLAVNLSAEEKDETCAQAHKIKGAAGSLGLARARSLANQIQQGDHPAWWQNVHDWVEQLNQAYHQDMVLLKEWLAKQDM